VRHRLHLTILRQNFSEPDRPPHHHVHAADRRCELLAQSGRRASDVEELRNGRDELGWCEWFFEKDAAGDALRGPLIRRSAGHVDDRKCWVRLPHPSGDIPTAQPSHQTNVRDERLVLLGAAHEQSKGLFGGGQNICLEAGLGERVFQNALQRVLVFDDEN